jgi:hypothetical protein
LFFLTQGIRKAGSTEKIWAEASADSGLAAVGGPLDEETKRSSAWPIVMFMSLVMGGPYLIWKLLRSVLSNIPESTKSQGILRTFFWNITLTFSPWLLKFLNGECCCLRIIILTFVISRLDFN